MRVVEVKRAAFAALLIAVAAAPPVRAAESAAAWLRDERAIAGRIDAAARGNQAVARPLVVEASRLLGRAAAVSFPGMANVYCTQAAQAVANYGRDIADGRSGAADRGAWQVAQVDCEREMRVRRR